MQRHMERLVAWGRVAFVLAFAGLLLKCHQAIFTAPPGSTVELFANPDFIPSNGGVSVITAILTEPAGTPVSDGTVVQFFTTLGRIDEQARTNDGVARVNLISDSRSGTAQVTALSGGGSVAGPSPTPTPTAAPSTTSAQVFAASILANSKTIPVRIGAKLPERIIPTAFPQRLTDKRASLITANVFDADGNPVANVPIIFTVEPGDAPDPTTTTTTTTMFRGPSAAALADPLTEFMDSQGSPTFTDNNGQAQDVMRTRYDPSAPPKTVKVRATSSTGKTETVTVYIN